MHDCKPIKVPIPVHTKLFADQRPKPQEEIEYMTCVPYANAIGSPVYSMVNTQQYISYAVGVLRRYMVTPGKEHWKTVKRVFRYLHGMTNLQSVILEIMSKSEFMASFSLTRLETLTVDNQLMDMYSNCLEV